MERLTSIPLATARLRISLPTLVMLFAFGTVLCWGRTVLVDPDTYMHVAVGRWILAHHAAPHVGIFSETMPNARWVADEWLAQAILGLLYTVWGWNGLVLATALSFAAALAALTRYLLRWLEPVHALIAVIFAAGMTLPHLLSRPHIFTFPILVFWFGALVVAREHDRAPPFWLLPLMTLWANLHGSFMFGLIFLGIFAGEALYVAKTNAARLTIVKRWGLFGVLAIAASIITPFGIYTLWLPFHIMRMSFALSALNEWQSPNFEETQLLEAFFLGALALALMYRPRLPLTRVGMIVLLVHMALAHRRNVDFLGFLTPLLIGPFVGAQLQSRVTQQISSFDSIFARLAKPANFSGMVATAAVLLMASAGYVAYPLVRLPDIHTPSAAVQAARESHLTDGRVFNEYGFGGYLMFSGIAPFIDGRAELYGDTFFKRYHLAIWGATDDLPSLLDEYHITWSIFAAGGTAATLMAHIPGWRRVYADKIAVVYARLEPTGQANKVGIEQ